MRAEAVVGLAEVDAHTSASYIEHPHSFVILKRGRLDFHQLNEEAREARNVNILARGGCETCCSEGIARAP